jgi:hypothetical protein
LLSTVHEKNDDAGEVTMITRPLCLVLLCAAPSAVLWAQAPAQPQANAAFERLRALSGHWQGTVTWSTAHTPPGRIEAEYYLTGDGSALVENLIMGGAPSMTSVYHLDGAELRMTHYCASHTQPRLKASTVDLEHGQITFSFVDITNLSSPTAAHMDGLELHVLGPDHVTLRFHVRAGDKAAYELIDLTRKT